MPFPDARCLSPDGLAAMGIAKKPITFRLHHAASQLAGSETPSRHLTGREVELSPAQFGERGDGRAEHDVPDPGPENRPLTHDAWLGCRVEPQRSGVSLRERGKPVDGVDLAVPCRILVRTIPATTDHFAGRLINDDRTEGAIRNVVRGFNRKLHESRVILRHPVDLDRLT